MSPTLTKLAQKIDAASEKGSASTLRKLIGDCENLLGKARNDRVTIWFLISNCYAGIAWDEQRQTDTRLSWKQDNLVQQVLSLRRATIEPTFHKADKLLRCKVLTNLANVLSSLGRPIEAIRYWDETLQICPIFAMALGNRGKGITEYARSLYDYGHTATLIAEANKSLARIKSGKVLWDSGPDPQAEEYFLTVLSKNIGYLERVGFDHARNLEDFPLGKTKGEKDYRQWCLCNSLYLSPLNDAIQKPVSAHDVMHLPDHTYKIEEHPRFPDYFNLLKQEYVSARFILYEAMQKKSHYANNDVLLLDGLDAASYGYRTEQLKIAFRVSYSIFDKISVFLNDYYSVGLEVRQVRFKSIWGKKNKNDEFQLYPCFAESENWLLRGLYYLSKDFFDPDFEDVSSPDAKKLDQTRNFIEHKFLTLQHYNAQCHRTDYHSYLPLDEFEEKTLKILRTAREALIYLSLAMHREESRRSKSGSVDFVFPIISEPVREKI